jgi:hypothetical protein
MDAVIGSAQTRDPQSLRKAQHAVAGRKKGLRIDGVSA